MFMNTREAIAMLSARPHGFDLHCLLEILLVVSVALIADASDIRALVQEVFS